MLAWLAAPAAVGLLTFFARQVGANATAAGVLYLVLVLALAGWGGWPAGVGGGVPPPRGRVDFFITPAGVVASIAATVCLDVFFIPPFGTLNIADPGDAAALASFLAAAFLAARLVLRSRRQAEEADVRRREVEILYELCFGLFTAGQRPGGLGEAAARTLSTLGARAGVLVLAPPAGGAEEEPHVIGEGQPPLDGAALERVRDLRSVLETAETSAAGVERVVYIPLLVGGLLDGILVARGAAASRKVLESAGRLLALAVERERLLTESAHLAAVRASDALKTSLLRAVSHDLRTPLTAMQLGLEGLRRHLPSPEAAAGLRDVAREQERLARRIDNLLALARLEAGAARPHPEDLPAGALFRSARESLALVLAGRPVAVRVDRDCPDLWADPSLALEIVVNLLENAARAAPAGSPLELAAAPAGPGRVWVEVSDRGPGIPAGIRRMLQTPRDLRQSAGGSGDSASGGLGLQIARSFAEAGGGSLALLERAGGGTVARLELPAAPEVEVEEAEEMEA
jgi:two-component system sensor histidine kinase KdpD